MEFELYPTIILRPRSFNALLAPREMFVQALNSNLNLQRFKVLYVSWQLLCHPEQAGPQIHRAGDPPGFHSLPAHDYPGGGSSFLIIVEHDPLLYEDAQEMTEYVSQAMREAAKDATVLLYAPGADPYFEDLTRNADRVFYFEEGPRASPRIIAKAHPREQKSQTTLEAYS